MNRSLFFSILYRFLLTAIVVVAVCFALPARFWLLKLIIAVAAALFFSVLQLQLIRRMLKPIQRSAAHVGAAAFPPEPVLYTDLEPLAHLLSETSTDIANSLRRADESRRELEALLDSMQDAVVAVDSAGRIQWTNEPMRRLMTGEAVSGSVRVGHALVQTVRDPDVLACVKEVLEHGKHRERRALSLLPGSIFEVSASPMPEGGAVAVLHDITRIEEVERTQKDFVANVSHELRTPLTSITGYVETLLDHEVLSPAAREFLNTILKNATRMHRLTEDLLVLARVESGEEEARRVSISAADLVNDAVKGVAGLVRDSDAELEIGTLAITDVMADDNAIVQVLTNLIENAIKYGGSGSGMPARVVISAEKSRNHPNAILFRVRDFGPGIASEHLGRIFERFYRVDKARSRELEGTGLGLAIAQHIIGAHGGAIWAESEMGRGSTFCFTLPEAHPNL